MNELTEFLRRNRACAGGIRRLENLGAETLEQAWEKAAPADLVWGVTRPGVMSPEQRIQFLVFVLESIEARLTDARSKNILEKLRTKSPITEDDASAAMDAALASSAAEDAALVWATDAAAWAVSAAEDDASSAAEDAALVWATDAALVWATDAAALAARATRAAERAARAARAAARATRATRAAERATRAARAAARATRAARAAASATSAAEDDAWKQQARWIRTNFRLADLRTK